jgi:sugar/nucleoside kinase (ribokinase family)
MAREVEVIDTIGAGDTFLGYIAASISKGESFSHAYKLANIASSLTCTKVGAQNAMPYLEEVMEHFDSSPNPVNINSSLFSDKCEVIGIDISEFVYN